MRSLKPREETWDGSQGQDPLLPINDAGGKSGRISTMLLAVVEAAVG